MDAINFLAFSRATFFSEYLREWTMERIENRIGDVFYVTREIRFRNAILFPRDRSLSRIRGDPRVLPILIRSRFSIVRDVRTICASFDEQINLSPLARERECGISGTPCTPTMTNRNSHTDRAITRATFAHLPVMPGFFRHGDKSARERVISCVISRTARGFAGPPRLPPSATSS